MDQLPMHISEHLSYGDTGHLFLILCSKVKSSEPDVRISEL